MNEPVLKSIERSQSKCPLRYRVLAWICILSAIALILFVLIYLPIVVEIALVAVVLLAAIVLAKSEGIWKGLKFFVKQILLGL